MDRPLAPPVNEAVYLLHLLDPRELTALKERYPDIASQLELGQLGGVGAGGSETSTRRLVGVMQAALRAAERMASDEIARAKARIRTTLRLKLAAQVTTAVTASSALASVLANRPTLVLASSTTALLGALANIVADHRDSHAKARGVSTYDGLEAAIANCAMATSASRELDFLVAHDSSDQDFLVTMGAANALCAELVAWVKKVRQ